MKALTNILSHLLMLLMLFIVACTEETAEVDNLMRQEQYVTVRMNIPGMTATATRAADGVIESITALAFDDADKLLEIETITTVTNTNTNNGFKGTFNLTVPNGTQTIHFLANLPENYDLSGVQKESDLTTLTTNDYNNLVYWGMTTYEGTTNTLSTTLYRNMAKITLAPDEEFPFEGELTIAGLTNPNNWGYLVPWKDGIYTDGRVPNEPDLLTLTPIGKDGAGYGTSLYVLEHDNPNTNDGLYVICRIGDAFYKVALTSNGIDPYKIKRNHEYIIYVSDVDDYQADEYRTAIGDNIKENYDIAAGKKPINLKVKEMEGITATITNGSTLYYDSDDAQVVTVNVTIPDGVEALNILAEDFSFGEDSDGEYTYAVNSQTSATLSFTLKSGLSARTSTITFSDASGNATEDAVNVNLIATPTVSFSNTGKQTLYWNNGSPTSFQVQMTGNNVPNDKTVTLTITAQDFTVTAQNGTALTQNGNVWTYTGTLTTLTFTPTSSGDDKPINITGEGENVNVNSANISVDVDATLLAVTPIATTINMDNSETSTILTLTKPGNITNLKVTASNNNAFTINGNAINGDYYIGGLSSNNETINYTIALRDGFNTAGEYTITFTDNGGGGQSVTATITVKNTPSLQYNYTNKTLYLLDSDGASNPTSLDVKVTVPDGSTLNSLTIEAPGFIVKNGEQPLINGGTYTDDTERTAKSSVTYTFTPIPNKTDYAITFSSTDDDLIADEEIEVTVKNEKAPKEIVIWESDIEGGTPVTWNRTDCRIPYGNFVEKIPNLKIGDQITINYIGSENASVQVEYGDKDIEPTKVQIKGDGNNDNVISCKTGSNSYTFAVNSATMVEMLLKYDLVLIGTNTSILSITAKETPTP